MDYYHYYFVLEKMIFAGRERDLRYMYWRQEDNGDAISAMGRMRIKPCSGN